MKKYHIWIVVFLVLTFIPVSVYCCFQSALQVFSLSWWQGISAMLKIPPSAGVPPLYPPTPTPKNWATSVLHDPRHIEKKVSLVSWTIFPKTSSETGIFRNSIRKLIGNKALSSSSIQCLSLSVSILVSSSIKNQWYYYLPEFYFLQCKLKTQNYAPLYVFFCHKCPPPLILLYVPTRFGLTPSPKGLGETGSNFRLPNLGNLVLIPGWFYPLYGQTHVLTPNNCENIN